MKYKTLLFDADGTLFDFKKSEREAFKDSLSHFGFYISDVEINDYSEINDALWKMLEKGEITKEQLRVRRFEVFIKKYGYNISPVELANIYFYQLSNKSYLLENSFNVCQSLSEYCNLYIITNGFKEIQLKRFKMSPISKLFSGIFVSEDIGIEKPAKEYFDIVSSRIENFEKSTSLVIGDSLSSDIIGGINAGIDVCWFNPLYKKKTNNIQINYTIHNLNELNNIITNT